MRESSNEDKRSTAEETHSDSRSISRRHLLKTVGASSSALWIGAESIDSAAASHSNQTIVNMSSEEKTQMKRLQQSYSDPRAAEKAIRTHGKQLLKELEQRKIITSISRSALNMGKVISAKEYANGEVGMGVTSFLFMDVPTAHIHTTKETSDQHVTIVVEPQLKRAYAIVKESVDAHNSANIIDISDKNNMIDSQDHERDPPKCFASYSGTYCLWDSTHDDPTPKDNCWYNCEGYHWYCSSYRRGCCYIGNFDKCCDNNGQDLCRNHIDCICQ